MSDDTMGFEFKAENRKRGPQITITFPKGTENGMAFVLAPAVAAEAAMRAGAPIDHLAANFAAAIGLEGDDD